VFDHREPVAAGEVGDVGASARREVVDNDDLVSSGEEEFGQVGADEAAAAGE